MNEQDQPGKTMTAAEWDKENYKNHLMIYSKMEAYATYREGLLAKKYQPFRDAKGWTVDVDDLVVAHKQMHEKDARIKHIEEALEKIIMYANSSETDAELHLTIEQAKQALKEETP